MDRLNSEVGINEALLLATVGQNRFQGQVLKPARIEILLFVL
jgi:hypothetical protein